MDGRVGKYCRMRGRLWFSKSETSPRLGDRRRRVVVVLQSFASLHLERQLCRVVISDEVQTRSEEVLRQQMTMSPR